MKRLKDLFWPAVGLLAAGWAFYLLYNDPSLAKASFATLSADLRNIPSTHYALAALCSLSAYAALAWYDRIALAHIGRKLSWLFISLTSFTTYALSHNIGASVFSGAVVRYRAYSSKGLSAAEVGMIVAFCSFTFFLGMIMLGGIVLVAEPEIIHRLSEPGAQLLPFRIHLQTATLLGYGMLSFVLLYIIGSVFHLKPLMIGRLRLAYPQPYIVASQLAAGLLELLGCAGIIYFALPSDHNPGYFVVLGVFLISFAGGLASNAPGALGVLEFLFVRAMPNIPAHEVLAALIVWRGLYLIVPLTIAISIATLFERRRLTEASHPTGESGSATSEGRPAGRESGPAKRPPTRKVLAWNDVKAGAHDKAAPGTDSSATLAGWEQP